MEKGTILTLKSLVDYNDDSIISRKIVENKAGGVTLFAFDKDQRLSEHTAPFDAVVQVVEGEAEIFVDQKLNQVKEGELIVMPANIPHAVNAKDRFKMLLTMIKG